MEQVGRLRKKVLSNVEADGEAIESHSAPEETLGLSIYSGKIMSTKSEVRWRFFSSVMLIVLAVLTYVLVTLS
ncbi:hypothetical protein [Serratia silvae]|uniref:Transcriptional regulator n=1 Tax=Serratia silvae TaxID=2824122 RepID=A0ABT0K875_9GAMM|nr:hypothetical protein [Serratia silvae]MCL1028240.1 hypothetical protein [Serratia silvae]